MAKETKKVALMAGAAVAGLSAAAQAEFAEFSAANPYANDPAQVAVAIGYKNEGHIAGEILPIVPVDRVDFKYDEYPLAESFESLDGTMGRKGRATELEYGGIEKTGGCIGYGFFASVPVVDQMENRNSRKPDPVNRGTEKIMEALWNQRERRTATICRDTDNYDNVEAFIAAEKLNADGVNAYKTILELLDVPIIRPNQLTLGFRELTKLQTCESFVKAWNNNSGDSGVVPVEALARLLRLDRVLVGNSRINTAAPGKPANIQPAFVNDLMFHYRAPVLDTSGTPTWGFTGEFGDPVTDKKMLPPGEMGVFGGTRVFAGHLLGEVVSCKPAGLLLQNPFL